jgi:hypothetical protein
MEALSVNRREIMSDWVAPALICLAISAFVAVAVLLALAE